MGGSDQDQTHIGAGREKTHLIAVAIFASMEKQGRTLAVVSRPYAHAHPILMNERIEIPERFVTDFASIPKFLHGVVQPFGHHAPAAVLHDFLYAAGQPGSRRCADFLIREAMRESGVPLLRRNVMFVMVRLFDKRGFGLEADWAFCDHEHVLPIHPPCARPQTSFLRWKEWRDLKKVERAIARAAKR